MRPKASVKNCQEGKQCCRCNEVRHELNTVRVIGAVEDVEDYKAFEAVIITDYNFLDAGAEGGVTVMSMPRNGLYARRTLALTIPQSGSMR
jgi:hypothetical protein